MAASATNVMAACAAAAAVACGGAVIATNVPTADALRAFAPAAPPAAPTFPEAARLAKQGGFGPTIDLINHIQQTGVGGWLDEQFAATGSDYSDLAARVVPRSYCFGRTGSDGAACSRDYLSATPVAMRFYADAVSQNDQLRQRVAFALSQLIVVSDIQTKSTAGIAALNQILLTNAFGNYRDILRAVTLNPAMGDYLNLADSNKTAPSENYARELMQLFSIGVNQLNPDGTLVKDAAGAPVAAYTSSDVHEIARALTGWTYARIGAASASDSVQLDYSRPMVPAPTRYDTGAKTFLGRTVPAGASQTASLEAVIDAVFNQSSTAPYIARYLIQQLVVSNPSPAFVGRVSRVFADNGAGVRGDLKAVVRAILTDPEARAIPDPNQAGKVKEPALLMLGLVRAIGGTSDGYAMTTRGAGMGQPVFHAPSVFGVYPPDYPLPLGAPLLSPASKLMTTATVIARHNLTYDWTLGGDARPEFSPQPTIAGSTGTQLDWAAWQAYGTDVDGQLDRINLLMLEGGLTAAQRTAIRTAMLAVTNADPATQARRRAQTALYIAASSPLFQIDR